MVEYLTMKRIANSIILAAVFFMYTVQAEGLKDPTQPPASLGVDNTSPTSQVPSGLVLQSVMIGAQYRAAIINGQKVLLGKKYEQATLIKLNEHEAVLRNQDGSLQTLTMGYAIEKKVLSPTVALPAKKRKAKHASKTE